MSDKTPKNTVVQTETKDVKKKESKKEEKKDTENECEVCYESFTKQPSKKRAQCPYCDIKVCVKCTQTY